MTRQAICGFEFGSLTAEGTITGTAVIESTIVHSGAYSLKIAPASGATSRFTCNTVFPFTAGWVRFYIRVTALPATTQRGIFGQLAANSLVLQLNPAGTIEFNANNATVGTSTTALTDTNRWYLIEARCKSGTSVDCLRIDGNVEVTGTPTITNGQPAQVGCTDTTADTYTAYFDDVVWDDADFPGPGEIIMVLPTADSAVGTGWTNDAAGTSNLWDAENNRPPAGIADTASGSGLHQIRNATSNANVNYDATMQTYTAAGISGTIKSLWPAVWTGAPVSTGAKQGTLGVVSNPTIANIALSSGGTSGAFWAGTAAGTWATGWKLSFGTQTNSPVVTLGTAPVMRVTQVTSSTRIAMCCFMGMYTDFTPPRVAARMVSQANARAASY